ncbi:primosomal protein N' [Geotalea sp. SG265]|uniref:replication restart helicase PriA n=1 Tax=Geotalea sp. SG265 TaxID=2922867 RepID=UPI001FAF6FB8|nr:primosomal protein N' [Geotalea sp. SG265]
MTPEQNAAKIIEVAVPLPLDATFHYSVPDTLAHRASIGVRVLIPFGRRKITGYVVGTPAASAEEVREIVDVFDEEPLFTEKELAFFRWSAAYYFHPLGEVIKAALPAGINLTSRKRNVVAADGTLVQEEVLTGGRPVKRETFYRAVAAAGPPPKLRGTMLRLHEYLCRVEEAPATQLRREFAATAVHFRRLLDLGLVAAAEREVYRDPFREEVFVHDLPLALNVHQAAALEHLSAAVARGAFAPFLLHGVTGSGKTEVYLQAIARVLEKGGTALVLVPEIALTPQLVKRFKSRFTSGIAVLHSGLSDGERYDEWRRIRRREVTIVIGARSALFAPLTNLGIIVVDEEHESSYKQSEGFRYNARDLALVRGKMEGAVVVLGSATPLVTTYHAVQQGKIGYLQLPERVRSLPMPTTELLDSRGRKSATFLPELVAAMGDNLANGGQTLLFLNRRGFATYLVCEECGTVLSCPNCSVTLTYHRRRERHFCHYCDYSIPAPSVCPKCDSPSIALLGRGTERVEEEVRELYPDAGIGRMDRDTTSGRGGHSRVLKGLENGTVDILVGTQMIAKGHDFPGVTLVGVISADATLNIPDFRSSERTFQLISQVIGRAGRGDMPGRVLIQTLNPGHYAITRAVAHDFTGFYQDETAFRAEAGYPPFAYLAALIFSGNSAQEVDKGATAAAGLLQRLKGEARSRVEILGPVSSPLAMIRGRYRRQILLKSGQRPELHRLVARFRKQLKLPAVVRMAIDIDPLDML